MSVIDPNTNSYLSLKKTNIDISVSAPYAICAHKLEVFECHLSMQVTSDKPTLLVAVFWTEKCNKP